MPSPRVLILTPWVPYPVTGACQQDRFNGLKQMQSLGFELRVIAKIHSFQPKEEAQAAFAKEGIPLTLVPHSDSPLKLVKKMWPKMIAHPSLLDGAALEYAEPEYQQVVRKAIEEFKPDIAWLEYTMLWPLLPLLKEYKIPAIMKSSLNEPYNCRDENGWSLPSILKSIPKYWGEKIAATQSDFIFGITPVEEQWYRSWGATRAGTLPLRGLSKCFTQKKHENKDVLDVVFLSSNYNMGHNRDALVFLLTKVIPLVRQQAPGKFRFHLTGKKFPKACEQYLADDVKTTGFVEDLGALLATMDIALCPWISGHGMQQKVFEPLCRGLPLITTKTAGYPFEDGKEVLLASTAQQYVDHLLTLTDAGVRQKQADAAYAKAQTLFSEDTVKHIVDAAVKEVLAKKA